MADNDTSDITTEQVDKNVPNPTGKGGFGDNPQNINAGGRPKNQESFTYWYNYFKNMTVTEFMSWEQDNPEAERTVAASLAYARMVSARKDLKAFQEIADRTEGKARQSVDLTSDGKALPTPIMGGTSVQAHNSIQQDSQS